VFISPGNPGAEAVGPGSNGSPGFGIAGRPLSTDGGSELESGGNPGTPAMGSGEVDGNWDWGGKVGDPGLVGLPSGKGGRVKSPEVDAGAGAGGAVEASGSVGMEVLVSAGGGEKAPVSGDPEAGGSAGKPELSGGNPEEGETPIGGKALFVSDGVVGGRAGRVELSGGRPGAVEGDCSTGEGLLAGSAGRPESGVLVDGIGGKVELSEGKAGTVDGKALGDELSPGKGGNPEEGLFSAPGREGGVFSPGVTG
jgi:hypothetical protein